MTKTKEFLDLFYADMCQTTLGKKQRESAEIGELAELMDPTQPVFALLEMYC